MADENWRAARLIPVSGIGSQQEAERRATSALLAVLESVKEFGIAITKPMGAPVGPMATFIEVPFKLDDRSVIPDGVIEVTRAGRTWTCLVEVKTGSVDLEREQVECYLDVARAEGFDAVLTISNQLSPLPGLHPLEVDKRKLRKVALHHLSWTEVLTTAIQQRVHRGIHDPDQAWILGELIRYLTHQKSGAQDFNDMGADWVTAREAIAAGTLRMNDKSLPDVVTRWEQLLRFAALRLGRELGADVHVVMSRKEATDFRMRLAAQSRSITADGQLLGTLRIPAAIAPLDIAVDLRAARVVVSVDVDAPREGRATTRVSWLLRQLKDAPEGLRIDAFPQGSRTSRSELLGAVREDPTVLLDQLKREPRLFRIAATSAAGPKRGTGRGAFIDSVLAATDGFYEAVMQHLQPWSSKAPQLPKSGKSAAEEAGLELAAPPEDSQDQEAVASPDRSLRAISPVADVHADNDSEQPAEVVSLRPATESAGPGGPADTVEWEAAQRRIEHERVPNIEMDADDEDEPGPDPELGIDAPTAG
jgi:hypothetical protein